MRAMVMRTTSPVLEDHPLELADVPTPTAIQPSDVVVRVAAAGVCRTDLHLLTGEMEAPTPLVLGHENAGWVHEVGSAVTTVQVGDPVLCFPFVAHGLSRDERSGLDTGAPDRATPGITVDGGYAEFLLTNERAMLPVPAVADLAALATLTDAGLAAYRGAKRAASVLRPGDTAVVVGVGGLGHLGVQILRALSPAHVVAIDPNPAARDLALECGAHEAHGPDHVPSSLVGSVRATLDFVGSDTSARQCLHLLAFGGHHYAIGVGGTMTFSIAELVEREHHVEGIFVGTYTELVEVTALCLSGDVTPRVTRYALGDANAALGDLAAGRVLGRAVLEPTR